jgi:uncharacterized membrane protein YfcA
MMSFLLMLGGMGILAGGVAAVTGFGIGSLLTPTLALQTGTKVAVAAISIPHLVGTAYRFWLLRAHVDRTVLWSFGITSAAGGLAGALLHANASTRALSFVFAGVLMLAGLTELSGWVQRIQWGRRAAWIAGAVSGALGGMVGNQGGIRAGAMLGFQVPKESFVATATAIGLMVDLARMPVYLVTAGRDIVAVWPQLLVATAAVLLGTVIGRNVLNHIPQRAFRRLVAVLLILLGAWMALRANEGPEGEEVACRNCRTSPSISTR